MGRKRSLYYGVGLNDSDYLTRTRQPCGKVVFCPYFLRWKKMLERCYAKDIKSGYEGCTVCEEWLTFSNFKSWMQAQDWEGKELDKDLLVEGNKQYSPNNCCFLTKKVNSFLVAKNTEGCTYRNGRFQAQCSDPFGINKSYIGKFKTKEEAKSAWLKVKNEYANILADEITDIRISEALRSKYKE